MNQEIATCAFCRADKPVMRKYLYAKNKPFDYSRNWLNKQWQDIKEIIKP